MDRLIHKLKKFTIEMEKNKDKIFYLREGEDITELIKKCKTDQDILDLANKIRDELIPMDDQYEYRDLNGLSPSFAEENAAQYVDEYGNEKDQNEFDEEEEEDHTIARRIIENYHNNVPNAETLEAMEEDDENDELQEKVLSYLGTLEIDVDWNDWGECLGSLKYDYPDMLDQIPFDDPLDIIEIVEYHGTEMTNDEKFDIIKRFFIGELNEKETIDLCHFIIQHFENSGVDINEYVEAPGEYEEEMKEDLQNHFDMVEDDCEMLEDEENKERIFKRLREMEEAENLDYDTLCEIGDEIDDLHDVPFIGQQPGDVNNDEETKKARIEFDMKDDAIAEIKFEQRRTDLLFDPYRFGLLVKEITQDFGDYDFTPDAIEAIQTAGEDYLINLYRDANLVAISGELTHIQPRHIQTARRVSHLEYYE